MKERNENAWKKWKKSKWKNWNKWKSVKMLSDQSVFLNYTLRPKGIFIAISEFLKIQHM
jgi:hypothetical protein